MGKGVKLHTTLRADYNLKTDWEIWKEKKLRMQQLNAERKNGEGTGEDKEQERIHRHTHTHPIPKRASKNVSLYQAWWDMKFQTSRDLQLKEV